MQENDKTLMPWEWARDAWKSDPLEFLMPVGAGVALAQFLTVVFALRSSHHFLLLLVVTAAGFALLRTAALLVQLSQEDTRSAKNVLSVRDLLELFVPLLASVALYAVIAPSARPALFFAAVSLPHLALLAYISKRYAEDAVLVLVAAARLPRAKERFDTALQPVSAALEVIGTPVLQLGRTAKALALGRQPVEKIPQIG